MTQIKKINVAELLKNCPEGMELDCTMYDNVTFDCVLIDGKYPISVKTPVGAMTLTEYGQCFDNNLSKCVIFPKGKTTWEGFQRPFKDGDIVATDFGKSAQLFIFKEYTNAEINYAHCYMTLCEDGTVCFNRGDYYVNRFATEEEKQKLFDAIRANGYKWNDETKILEKLIEPKFKVGDKVKSIFNRNQYIIKELTDNYYTLVAVEGNFKYTEPIIEDKNWELAPNKFNISNLKPFDQVLVRDNNEQEWTISFFGSCTELELYKYSCIHGVNYAQCIPYKGNEHLLDKTNDCDEFYKNW